MSAITNIAKIVRGILLVFFLMLIALVLIPSFVLLSSVGGVVETQHPPSPPEPPTTLTLAAFNPKVDPQTQVDVYTQQVNAYTQQVNAYTQQVSAYTQQIDAYKTFGTSPNYSQQTAMYQLVVKDTLLSVLNVFITALLGYAFVSGTAQVINNFILVSKGHTPEKLKIL